MEAQRTRDAVEVPGLSPAAWEAVRAVEQAGTPEQREAAARGYWDELVWTRQPAVAEAWARAALGRPGVETELRAVAEAAARRLGEDGARELMRSAGRGAAAAAGARAAQDGPGSREGMAAIGRAVVAAGEGQRAHAGMQERTREVEQERLGLRSGPKLGM